MNPLLDKDFLKALDEYQHHDTYARITVLSQKELPLERIEGKVTSGSVNVDGSSAVRRTCNLSIVADEVNINDFYWGLNNKFQLESGLKNNINPNYPDIIWFPQGVYVITSFNTSLSTSGFNVSISGKDKMCMLNGEVGGSLPASVDFGVEEFVDKENQITTFKKVPIKKLIKEMLHAFAMEPYHNIIINDLESSGLELLEYRGDTPAYLLYDMDTSEYTQIIFDQTKKYKRKSDGKEVAVSDSSLIVYKSRIDDLQMDNTATILTTTDNKGHYQLSKLEYGQTAGYRLTDLVYAGDLISGIGESITSILDKIVSMLGSFEYFYDLYGRFVFQKKPIFVQTSWNNIIKTEDDTYVENASYVTSCSYHFEGNNLISSFQNSPNLNNLRNDYSVWGSRKTINDVEVPVHYRYAIHKKPKRYVTLNGEVFDSSVYDWREIIYQMAKDYYAYNEEDDFCIQVGRKNPDTYPFGITGYEQFYLDIQGFWRELYDIQPEPEYYEYIYPNTDEKTFTIESSISELYIKEQYKQLNASSKLENRDNVYVLKTYNGILQLQKLIDTIKIDYNSNTYYITAENGFKKVTTEIQDKVQKYELYLKIDGKYVHITDSIPLDNTCYLREDTDQYISISSLPPALQKLFKNGSKYNKYNEMNNLDILGNVIVDQVVRENFNYYVKYYEYFTEGDYKTRYWNKQIKEAPDSLNFWIDFLDSSEVLYDEEIGPYTVGSELDRYAISAIGDRSKVVNDTNVSSIYFRDVPNLIFTTYEQLKTIDLEEKSSGYTFVFLQNDNVDPSGAIEFAYFNISAQGKSAKNKLDELLYNHSYCIETVNITAIPVYYLEPNTRVSIRDDKSKINGEYIISRISLPLTHSGMMSISATKAPQRLY